MTAIPPTPRVSEEMVKMPDAVRVPLHSLQADLDYLLGRYATEVETRPAIRQAFIDRLNELEAALSAAPADGWRAISEEAKKNLVDIWIETKENSGHRWSECYYDHICDEWRTSRPSGHLVCIPARYVTHWRPRPSSPTAGEG